MADTPVNPIAGSVTISGLVPMTVQRQPGMSLELWLISLYPDVTIPPVTDNVPITVRG